MSKSRICKSYVNYQSSNWDRNYAEPSEQLPPANWRFFQPWHLIAYTQCMLLDVIIPILFIFCLKMIWQPTTLEIERQIDCGL